VKALLALVIVLAAVAAGPVQQGYTFITDTLGGNGGPAAVTVQSASGFDWADAGIGASAAVGAIFVAFGSTLLVRRRSQITA
jgi:hypothetical protein